VALADPFLDEVVEVSIGELGGGGGADLVLGPPHGGGAFQGSTHTLSLGFGGSVVVAFTDNVVVDGPGPDLLVFENAFLPRGLTTLVPFAEPGTVSVSADGSTWRTFACAADAPPYFAGCAGVYPVFATDAASALLPSVAPIEALVGVPIDEFVPPTGAGGDAFDLAGLGLAAARFLRIDGSDRIRGLEGLAGFDLDAAAAVNSVETAGAADSDGDGVVDAADACPLEADPAQLDADGDGVGDVCEGDPLPADADGDGTPDALDPCPDDPRCVPYVPGSFPGAAKPRPGDQLLTYVQPTTARVSLPSGSSAATLVVAVAPEVEAGSVRVRVGRQDATAAYGPFVPGSIRRIDVPVDRRAIRVRLRARGGSATAPPLVDRDAFRFVVPKPERSPE
jgi:hypothetical protein